MKKKENIHDGSIKQHNNYKTQTGKKKLIKHTMIMYEFFNKNTEIRHK